MATANLKSKISLDDTQFTAGLRRVKLTTAAAAKRIGTSFRKIGGTIGKITKSLAKFAAIAKAITFAGAVVGVTRLLKASSGLAAKIEGIEVKMANFVGGTKNAKKILADISKFSTATPFETTGLQEVVNLLLGAGISAADAVPVMKELAAVSKDTGQVAELGDAVAKGFAKGKFQTEELNKFLERGINLMPQLEKVTGKTGEELKKAIQKGLSFNDVREAIARMSQEGGLFFGMLEKQSTTFTGLVSTLQSNWDELRNKLGQPINNALKPVLEKAIKLFQDIAGHAERIGEAVGGIISGIDFGALFGKVKPILERIIKFIKEDLPKAIKATAKFIGKAVAFVKGMFNTLTSVDYKALFKNLVTTLPEIVSLAFKIGLKEAVNFLWRALKSTTVAFGTLMIGYMEVAVKLLKIAAMPKFWEGVKHTFISLAYRFKEIILDGIAEIYDLLSEIPVYGERFARAANVGRGMADVAGANARLHDKKAANSFSFLEPELERIFNLFEQAGMNANKAFHATWQQTKDLINTSADRYVLNTLLASLAVVPKKPPKPPKPADPATGAAPLTQLEDIDQTRIRVQRDRVRDLHNSGFRGLAEHGAMQLNKMMGIGPGVGSTLSAGPRAVGGKAGAISRGNLNGLGGGLGAVRKVGAKADATAARRDETIGGTNKRIEETNILLNAQNELLQGAMN